MTDLESTLYDTLHAIADPGHALSGPALRRRARTRQLTVRGGSVVALGAAGTAAALVVPGLLASPASTRTGAVGAPSTRATVPSPVTASAIQPSAPPSTAAKPTPSSAAPTPSSVPGQAHLWNPSGDLIDNPTILADAPKVAATDSDWTSWSKDYHEGALLQQDTVSVVYAGAAAIRNSGPDTPRPLIVITGRASAKAPLQVAVVTSAAGQSDGMKLDTLTVEAMTPAATEGPQAIAVSNGLTLYVAASTGVDSATYSWADNDGTHTAAMTVSNGVAVAASPMDKLKASPNGKITNIRAVSQGKVVWDAAPVPGR